MAFDYQGAAGGAGSGSAIGGALGSFVPGIGTAIGTAAGGLLGGALGGFFGKGQNKETKIQKQQRELVDELLGSLRGNGPYANLFSANEADFEKGFAEPARARFRNVTAPHIQQQFIASGQHLGTGLEDALTRAGVDMDQLLNEQYMNYQQGAQNRRAGAIGQILGQGPGAAPQMSGWEAAMQGGAGYLSSPSFGSDIEGILNAYNKDSQTFEPARKGFEN